MGVAAYFFIYNHPATSKFLTKEEREHVLARLKHDGDATRNEKFTWSGVIQAFKDPKIYLYGLCFHTISLPATTFGLFLPTIINDLGYSAAKTQLLTIAPYIISFVTNTTLALLAERAKRRVLELCVYDSTPDHVVLCTYLYAGGSYLRSLSFFFLRSRLGRVAALPL